MQLPGNARTLLRDAVRNHPSAAGKLAGRKVNDLPKADLLALALDLGLDVRAIVAGAATAPIAAPAAIAPGRFADDLAAHCPPAETPTTQDTDQDTMPTQDDDTTQDTDKALAAEAADLRRAISTAMIEGDFDGVTTRLTTLLREAHKPAEVRTQIIYTPAPDGTAPTPAAPVAVPAPIGTATWAKLFGTAGTLAARKAYLYAPTPQTPPVDERYRWPDHVTGAALAAMGRGRNVWLYGPAGTGKTSFAEQIAARTGRPFILIPCDDTTEAPELLGMTVPHDGGVRWQDGVLTAALRIPHALVLIDEPSVARSGALMVLQSVLASRMLSIKETGETVRAAEGVRFIVADNTNGTGGGTAEGYEGTRRLNRATLDRFSVCLKLDYMQPAEEAAALVAHTACTPQLAELLVECAGLTRKARVTHALGLRRLIAWAECLTDGIDARMSLEFAILNSMAKDDREPTEQCCALGLDKKRIKEALAGRNAAPVAAAPAYGSPAADFAN